MLEREEPVGEKSPFTDNSQAQLFESPGIRTN
jgi:hypothetical protein